MILTPGHVALLATIAGPACAVVWDPRTNNWTPADSTVPFSSTITRDLDELRNAGLIQVGDPQPGIVLLPVTATPAGLAVLGHPVP